ncbi:MAG: UvrB/UvrC motif-containing protein [Candidatus Methylacidiphilales bacterium]|nr:UvrB/UvrC motif-containing protein [Candidatus Methylacidiphilales bacterium]
MGAAGGQTHGSLMHCERCQKDAAKVFLTQMVAGKLQKIDLCEKCARELGVTSNEPFALADLLLKSASIESGETPPNFTGVAGEDDPGPCPQCGCTLGDVRKTGRLGCATCYVRFSAFIGEAVENMQKGPLHHGKIPSHVPPGPPARRQELEQELARAIRAEDYEEAARLRDRLRELGATV